MKKILTAAILAIACIVSVFALASCEIKIEGDETWTYSAETKEDTANLLNNFMEKTLKNTNQVVTVKNGDTVVMVETIDGTKGHVFYSKDNQTYSFIDGENYIYAMPGEDYNTFWKSKTYYGYGYFAYKSSFVDIVSKVPEDDSVKFSCHVEGSGTFGEDPDKQTSSETIEIEIDHGEQGKIKINAESKNGLVEKYVYTITDASRTTTITLTFEYGNASVTVPDITGWYEQFDLE